MAALCSAAANSTVNYGVGACSGQLRLCETHAAAISTHAWLEARNLRNLSGTMHCARVLPHPYERAQTAVSFAVTEDGSVFKQAARQATGGAVLL